MNVSKTLKYFLVSISLIIGILLLIFSFLTLPNVKENFRNNFGFFDTLSVHKRILSATDNNQNQPNLLLSTILSCQFPDPKLEIVDPSRLDLIINKQVKLESNYRPIDLVNLTELGINTDGNIILRDPVIIPLQNLITEASKTGIKVRINSGYRDFETQQEAFNYWVRAVGRNKGEQFAAPVGGSEHHLGTVIDIVSAENNYKLLPSYENTKLNQFLKNNAHLYGFTMSYPKGIEHITGYNYEPWHYRYVGVELATYLWEKNMSLTQYLYQLNNYCLLSY